MSSPIRRFAAAALLTLSVAACQGDPAGPGDTELTLNADIAALAVQSVRVDIEAMGGPPGPMAFGLFGVVIAGPGGPFAARDLGCRNLTPPHVTITRTCTFKDAGGAVQATYDPATTATARIETSISGELARGSWSATLLRSSDVTVSGLAGTETQRSWSGTGAESIVRSQHTGGQAERAYTLETTVIINAVVVPVPGGPDKWPLSGSITRTLEGEITAGPRAGETISRTTTITFNGTRTVTMTVNGESFTVDLKAGRAARRR